MNTENSMGILILAAGQSRRFGSDKLMAKMPDGRPVVAHSLAPILAFSKAHNLALCIMTRADNQPLINYLTAEKIPYAISINAHLGMGHSLADGIKCNSSWQGWMIALADMPNITIALLNNLWDKIQENKYDVVRPVFSSEGKDIPAHPVYFPVTYRDVLQTLSGDNGARKIINKQIFLTHIDGECIKEETMIDVDTAEVLHTLHKQKERTV